MSSILCITWVYLQAYEHKLKSLYISIFFLLMYSKYDLWFSLVPSFTGKDAFNL